MKIKICYIVHNLGQGGAERQLVNLIRYIDKSRFEVTILLYAVNKGIFFDEIHEIPYVNVIQNKLRYKFSLLKIIEALGYLRRFLRSNDFSIIHTQLFMNGLLIRLVLPKSYSNRVIQGVRNSFLFYPKYQKRIEKYFIKESFIVTNTKFAADNFRNYFDKRYETRIYSISNGINIDKFYKDSKLRGNKIITIGNVGRQSLEKNQIQLINAIYRVNNDKVILNIVGGEGNQTNNLLQAVKDMHLEKKVLILPQQIKIEEYYQKFDIFILPSFYEGCPNVLFEAMLSGCLVIISHNANTDSFITDGFNGFVYNDTDNDLSTKIKYAVSILKSSSCSNIVSNARQYVVDNYSMKSMVSNYQNLYKEILYEFS